MLNTTTKLISAIEFAAHSGQAQINVDNPSAPIEEWCKLVGSRKLPAPQYGSAKHGTIAMVNRKMVWQLQKDFMTSLVPFALTYFIGKKMTIAEVYVKGLHLSPGFTIPYHRCAISA